MAQIRLSGPSDLAFMSSGGEDIGFLKEIDILLFIGRGDLFKDIVESNHDPNVWLYGYMS